MRLRADWDQWLHTLRTRELEIALAGCPPRAFCRGLELGAGDGFQSQLLVRWVEHLISTDFYRDKLPAQSNGRVTFQACDAQQVRATFPPEEFDFIFSSNLMEHLSDPVDALRQIAQILTDDGITIHIMPGPLFKVTHLGLYAPWQFTRVVEKVTSPGGLQHVLRWARRYRSLDDAEFAAERQTINNVTVARRKRPLYSYLLLPEPHGISSTHVEEWQAFQPKRWIEIFAQAGLEVIAVRRGPVTSGYGFGWDRARAWLEKHGAASEYIYIAAKRGSCAASRRWFQEKVEK